VSTKVKLNEAVTTNKARQIELQNVKKNLCEQRL